MGLRATWKGALSFGLVTIPVALHKATETRGVRFNQLHAGCGARIRLHKVCESGHEVEASEIVKGYALDKTTYVEMLDDDFEDLPLPSAHVLEVQRFVDADAIDPLMFAGGYFMSPDTAGDRGYSLILAAMKAEKKVGIARVAFREREHLAVIRPVGNYLVLNTLYWSDEIREPAYTVGPDKVNKQELDLARMLVTNLAGEWEPTEYHDAYREALMERIEAKAAGVTPAKATPIKTSAAQSLTDALAASVAAISKAKAPAKSRAKKVS